MALVFDTAWEKRRLREYRQRLSSTLGAFFTKAWIVDRGNDALVSFLITDSESVCVEFACTGYVEVSVQDLPDPVFPCPCPQCAWTETLKLCHENEQVAIAAVLCVADREMDTPNHLHVDSGEAVFLGALGLSYGTPV